MSGQHAEPEPEFDSSWQHHQQPDQDKTHKRKQPDVPPPTLAEQEAKAASMADWAQQELTRKSSPPPSTAKSQQDLTHLGESPEQNATTTESPNLAQAALARAEQQTSEPQEISLGDRQRQVTSLGTSAHNSYNAVAGESAQAADALQHRYHLQVALTQIQDCIALSEQVLAEISIPAEREQYFASVRPYHQLKIQILMALHQDDATAGYDVQAFETSEGSRARLHNEQLVRSGIDIREGANPALLAQERALLQKETRTPEEEAALQHVREQLKNDAYQNVDYYDPLKLAEIQNQILDDETALIYYSVQSEYQIFVWVVTRESFFTHAIDLRTVDLSDIDPKQDGPGFNLWAERRKQDRMIQRRARQGTDTYEYEQPSENLGAVLIQPLLEHLRAQSCSRIAISTEGRLDTWPFSTLMISDSSGEERFLVEDYEIVYLPSATSIAISREQAQAQLAELDPEAMGVFLLDQFPTSDQPSLPAALDEGANIWSHNPSDTEIFTRDEVTEESFLQATEAFTILHLVTHGLCKSSDLDNCGLILRDESGDDSMLTLPEIPSTEISMSTQLLVLSACRTTLGGYSASGEYVSIAHTFAQNGIPRVLGSLWYISDPGTRRFMEYFYEALLKGNQSPSAALQQAQKRMIALTKDSPDATVDNPNPEEEDWTVGHHPYFWAAFRLVGDWQWPPRF
ncbi:MAG: CHAT domain-containing protein [Cyanobacteria bacterium P01_G01_bin.54]